MMKQHADSMTAGAPNAADALAAVDEAMRLADAAIAAAGQWGTDPAMGPAAGDAAWGTGPAAGDAAWGTDPAMGPAAGDAAGGW